MVQGRFSKSLLFQAFGLVALIFAAHIALRDAPDREELGARLSGLHFAPAKLAAADFAPFRLAGAWRLTGDDPRLGGVSALALERARFIAVTDSGVVLRFARPAGARGRARLWSDELPGGPGNPRLKLNRDSEALALDPLGRGWWVGFENRNQLWLYDRGFAGVLARVELGKARWPRNLGIEGMVATPRGILAFPEAGDAILLWDGRSAVSLPLERPFGRIADAVRLPGGGVAVVHRRLTPRGFRNAITLLDPLPGGGFTTGRSFPLRAGALDNIEAIAAERLADGRTRLWLMTDDNYQRPLRTLLIALDVPRDIAG